MTNEGLDMGVQASQSSQSGVPNADVVCGEDGFHVFWPTENRGAYNANGLREIADQLDTLNLAWAEHIQVAFAEPYQPSPEMRRLAEKIVDSDRVLSVFAACEWNELHDDGKNWIAAIVAATLGGSGEGGMSAPDTYRGWTISQNRWPEPAWSATSPNYDAWTEGEGEWVDNGEKADGVTREHLIAEIDAWFEEHSDGI